MSLALFYKSYVIHMTTSVLRKHNPIGNMH